ncbi:hypothetical protein KDX14_12015 [Burkholderia cenocepacia]|uniref:hypothetical protein n=1 Tax=Burkholderia cenocepacia TaxID=95486 RepID=UPI001B95B51E|nr:hypothetical protein [Burkholderia cenocepacia]MBR8070231.1 hypothetical protein [Burkholderia cenocepacia]
MGNRLAAVVRTVRDGFQAMQKKEKPRRSGAFSGGASRSRTGLNGFAGRRFLHKINTLYLLTIQIDRSAAPYAKAERRAQPRIPQTYAATHATEYYHSGAVGGAPSGCGECSTSHSADEQANESGQPSRPFGCDAAHAILRQSIRCAHDDTRSPNTNSSISSRDSISCVELEAAPRQTKLRSKLNAKSK